MGCDCPRPEEGLDSDLVTHASKNKELPENEGKLILYESDIEHINYPGQKFLQKQRKPKETEVENFIAYNTNKINNIENNNTDNNPPESPKDDFSKFIFDHINQLRQNPKFYISLLENSKSNVTMDKKGIKIYKSCVKVAINTGEEAFDLAADILASTEPMPKLIYKPEITVAVPDNEEDIKSKVYLTDKVAEMINNGILIKSFWKDIIKDPETCFILMIVDDSGQSAGHKRTDILDPENKYIGISSVKIGKSFACYITLSSG